MFGAIEPWHLIILAAVLCALFGAKRLPDTARSVGQSLRIMRRELHTAEAEADAEVHRDKVHQNA